MDFETLQALIEQLLAAVADDGRSDEERADARSAALAAIDLDVVESAINDVAGKVLSSGADDEKTLAALAVLADGRDVIVTERSARSDASAARDAVKADLAARFTPETATADVETATAVTDADADGDADGTIVTAADVTEVVEAAPVVASAPRPDLAVLRSFQPADAAIVTEESGTAITIDAGPAPEFTAAVDVPGVPIGNSFVDVRQVADAIIRRRENLGSGGNITMERVPIMHVNYRDTLRVLSEDPVKAGLELQAAVMSNALTASGGFCAPAQVIYDFVKVNRPTDLAQDFLPVVGATRGAITFPTSADIRDAFNATLTRSYTNADDVASTHKVAAVVACPTFNNCTVGAQYVILQYGNFATKAYPEWVEHWTGLAMDVHAHKVSEKLINQMVAAATAGVGVGPNGGATATLLSNVSLAAADMREALRMDKDAPLEIVLPSWVPDLIQSDLARARKSTLETLAIPDGDIDGWFANRDVTVHWVRDWQHIAANPAVGAVVWPSLVDFLIYPPGTYIKLDMGTLDLGIVRDSVLNATNDYHIFVETFESACKRGIESRLYSVATCATGAFSADIALACSGVHAPSS